MTLRLSRPAAVDAAIVLLAVALVQFEIWTSNTVPGPRLGRALPLLLLLVVPLAVRRTKPLLATALVMGALDAYCVWRGSPEGTEVIAPLAVVSYSVAAFSSRRRAFAGLALLVATYTVYAVYDPNVTQRGPLAAENEWAAAFFGAAVIVVWLAGIYVRSRRDATQLARRTEAAELEAEIAVGEERARMARELHDIVSHNLSVVVLQAAGARAAGVGDDALEKIERSGREALVEMRRLLGVLREDGNEAALEPQPGIASLGSLVNGVRAAGPHVQLVLDGDWEGLPPALELCVYRIVQEALTNTLRHAEAERATVHVQRLPASVVVEVVDDGRASARANGGGHGLLGMAERVAHFRGELETGPRAEGGFAVRAVLPL